MKVWWPRSLFARLMLIWLLGMTLVLGTSFALFVGERERAGQEALFEGVAREIAAAAAVLDRLDAAERERWLDELGRRRLRLALHAPPAHLQAVGEEHPLRQALRHAMPERNSTLYDHAHNGMGHPMLVVASTLADGSPLLVRLPGLPPAAMPSPPSTGRVLAALAALLGGVLLLTWIAVRVATRPLSRMAAAAHALGEDPERMPLQSGGPTEVAEAVAAFNQMQDRIRAHVAERTRILAAVTHDLQTPITRLRLRAELVDDEALRERIQSDLDAMQTLVREGLAYARSLNDKEPTRPLDIDALAAALCDDAAELGGSVSLQGQAGVPCSAQAGALRRALWNLIENGIKFGQRVELQLEAHADSIELRIRDHGPGLPEGELEKVFEPFYRLEPSRNRETGGTGLGLAIVRNLLRAQQGEVRLRNHPRGGLEAIVSLQRADTACRR